MRHLDSEWWDEALPPRHIAGPADATPGRTVSEKTPAQIVYEAAVATGEVPAVPWNDLSAMRRRAWVIIREAAWKAKPAVATAGTEHLAAQLEAGA